MGKIVLRALVSLGLLGLLFFMMREKLPDALRALKEVRMPLFLVSVALFVATSFILAKRLQLIFEAEDVPLPMKESSSLTFVGYFFNNFLPTSVGGDIVKAMCAARVTGHPVKSVTSVLLDRVFGLLTFILIPSVSLLLFLHGSANKRITAGVYGFLAVALFFSLLLFHKGTARKFRFLTGPIKKLPFGDKLKQIYDGMHNFKRHKLVVFQALLLSVVGQTAGIGTLYLVAIALGTQPSPVHFFLIVPVVHLISMFPSLGGLGVRELAYTQLLAAYMGADRALALGVLYFVMLLTVSVIGGVIYLVRHDYHIRLGRAALS